MAMYVVGGGFSEGMGKKSYILHRKEPGYGVIPQDVLERLRAERRFPDKVRLELGQRGHPVNTVGDLDGPCSVEIIQRDPASGILLAGSDPRRDGWALAW
jgi:hypothetical protein